MNKRCIFSYCNSKVNKFVPMHQDHVIGCLVKDTETQFWQFYYQDETTPDKVLDYCVNNLLYEKDFETILILDIDCIPLSKEALDYTFQQAEKNILVGNIQRANHINNNEHLYVGPSYMCFTKQFYEEIGRPSFEFTIRGDVGEEITYQAEQHNKEIEFYNILKYEKLPVDGIPWKLKEGYPDFGIGTTFVNKHGQEMSYHLFQSIFHEHNALFYNKCMEVHNKK